MNQCLFAKTIYGVLASKSNGRRLVYWRGKSRLIKSVSALKWMNDATPQLCGGNKPITQEVRLICTVYYRSKLSDLDIELLKDSLQDSQVIKNDRQIVEIQARKRWDKEKPRVEVRLEVVDDL